MLLSPECNWIIKFVWSFRLWWHLPRVWNSHLQVIKGVVVLSRVKFPLGFNLVHSPFPQAAGGLLLPPQTALSVQRRAILPLCTKTPPFPSNSLTESQFGPNAPAKGLLLPITDRSVSTGTFKVIEEAPRSCLVPMEKMSACTSVAARVIMPSLGIVIHSQLAYDDFIFNARSPCLRYADFSSSIVLRLPLPHSLFEHSLNYNHISHPYNTNAFDSFLLKHDLSCDYPLLSFNLQQSFPLGCMPCLLSTVILPNNSSILPHMDVVDDYLCKEISSHRMSSPFLSAKVELILCGPFQSSPLIISIQPQYPGMPDKLCVCHHLFKATKIHASVNSYIWKDDFPTRFNLASKVADMVSLVYYVHLPILLIFYTPLCVSCVRLISVCCQLWLGVFALWMCYSDIVSLLMHVVCSDSPSLFKIHLGCFNGCILDA